MSDEKKPVEAPEEKPTRLRRKIFLWIFRKQIADIIYNHTESIKVRHVIAINKSVVSLYIEALEFIVFDIKKYFKLGSGLSARRAMREMQDFCSHKLATLRKLSNEYTKLEDNDGKRAEEISKHKTTT